MLWSVVLLSLGEVMLAGARFLRWTEVAYMGKLGNLPPITLLIRRLVLGNSNRIILGR